MKDALDPRRFDAIIHNDPCRSPRRQPDNNKIVPLPTKWQHMKINTRRVKRRPRALYPNILFMTYNKDIIVVNFLQNIYPTAWPSQFEVWSSWQKSTAFNHCSNSRSECVKCCMMPASSRWCFAWGENAINGAHPNSTFQPGMADRN